MDFVNDLLTFRAKYDLTQKQCAEILGTRAISISFYETRKNKPTQRNMIKFKINMEQYEKEHENNV